MDRKVGSVGAAVHRCGLLLVLAAFLPGLLGVAPASAQPTRTALEPFTGHWKGAFVAYTHAGERVDSLTAEHRYRWDGDVQVGTQVDRYPDGRVERHEAWNYAGTTRSSARSRTRTGRQPYIAVET